MKKQIIQVGNQYELMKDVNQSNISIKKGSLVEVTNIDILNGYDILDINSNIPLKQCGFGLFQTNSSEFSAEYLRKQVLLHETERENEHILDLENL